MFEGGFLIEKRHLLPLLSKLRPTCGVVFKLVELPRDWEQLADGDWAIPPCCPRRRAGTTGGETRTS